jgi:hypothetical protein
LSAAASDEDKAEDAELAEDEQAGQGPDREPRWRKPV